MKIAKKLFLSAMLGALLITGAVSAATNQSATVVLGPSSFGVESNKINGTSGTGYLGGYLNNASAARAIAEAKRVVPYYPDTQLVEITINATTPGNFTNLTNMSPDSDLYYVEMNRYNPLYSSNATGTIRNY